MNIELLYEFYQQSFTTIEHKPISGFDANTHDTIFVPEKFAELIIRECLSYAKDGDIDFMKFMIKKQFGVEE